MLIIAAQFHPQLRLMLAPAPPMLLLLAGNYVLCRRQRFTYGCGRVNLSLEQQLNQSKYYCYAIGQLHRNVNKFKQLHRRFDTG